MRAGILTMSMLRRAYLLVLHGMAGLAGLMMVVMMVSIVADVVLRSLGGQSSAHIFTFNEYFLFLIPFLGAPLLVREKGHVYVEALLMQFPERPRDVIVKLVLLVCIATCLVLACYAAGLAYSDYLRGELDVRSFDMPRWMLIAVMPLSLAMMGIEFGRFLVRGENPYLRADSQSVAY